MGASNYMTGILNFCTLVLSIPIIGAGIWLATKGDGECVRFLQWPVIIIGVFILLVSLAGFIGGCFRVSWLLWLYLFTMFILILLLFIFTIVAFVVTNKGAGHALSGKGYKEYRLGDYNNWLQKQVDKSSNWRRIRSCLMDSKVCKDLDNDYINTTVEKFYAANLSPIESGCCKPPEECGFTYQNATAWLPPATTVSTTNQDCQRWGNNRNQLCYNCDSCRAGVIQNVKKNWKRVAIVNTVVLVLLVIVYSIGCCAFRNARREKHYGYGQGYYGRP